MGCVASRLQCCSHDFERFPSTTHEPMVQMCASSKSTVNFADCGDEIILYADFGDCSPCRLEEEHIEYTGVLDRAKGLVSADRSYRGQSRFQLEALIANQVAELVKLHPAVQESNTYKAVVRIPLDNSIQIQDGEPVPVRLPYMTVGGQYQEILQTEIPHKYRVYFQSLWKQLKEHNIDNSLSVTSQSLMRRPVVGYGTMEGTDHRDAIDSCERQEIAFEQKNTNDEKPKRYWPDSWQMQCWGRHCCRSILRSDKPIQKFIAQFFVTPLTNVTGLSLHYQLYLNEIFHTTFWTRLGHYLAMPLIVLMMLTFFGQFRFVFNKDAVHCYETDNFEVLIVNGTLFLAVMFFLWYLIWGIVQKAYLMGVFMILPLVVLVILANIYFQLAIKNTMIINNNMLPCNVCWNYTIYGHGAIHYYNIFSLMKWYFNPVFWAAVLSIIQSLSHSFEPKIPPRVSQTAHWMSCTHMCKRMGFSKTICILSVQAVFGAVDEFLASPRLLPILILRVCYELGYQKKEWKWMKKLVKMCMEYGDPALDFIGIGGSRHPSTSSVVFRNDVSIDELKSEVRSMRNALTPLQQQILVEPKMMHSYRKRGRVDPFLQHYVTLRHYVAQYTLQVYAYGPFRMKYDEHQAKVDDDRMNRDFGDNASFQNFLHQVRFALWQMEDDLINRRQLSGCCEPPIDDI